MDHGTCDILYYLTNIILQIYIIQKELKPFYKNLTRTAWRAAGFFMHAVDANDFDESDDAEEYGGYKLSDIQMAHLKSIGWCLYCTKDLWKVHPNCILDLQCGLHKICMQCKPQYDELIVAPALAKNENITWWCSVCKHGESKYKNNNDEDDFKMALQLYQNMNNNNNASSIINDNNPIPMDNVTDRNNNNNNNNNNASFDGDSFKVENIGSSTSESASPASKRDNNNDNNNNGTPSSKSNTNDIDNNNHNNNGIKNDEDASPSSKSNNNAGITDSINKRNDASKTMTENNNNNNDQLSFSFDANDSNMLYYENNMDPFAIINNSNDTLLPNLSSDESDQFVNIAKRSYAKRTRRSRKRLGAIQMDRRNRNLKIANRDSSSDQSSRSRSRSKSR